MGLMRVLHVICTDAFAGVERYVATLAATQRVAGKTVVIVGGDPLVMGAAIGHLDVKHIAERTVLGAARAINAVPDVDVIHVHMTAAELASTFAYRAWRVPVVATRHFAARRGKTWAGRVIAPLVERRIRATISVSGYVAENIGTPSTIIHPGVPDRPDGALADQREASVLIAQRLEPEKRTDLGVEAFARSGLASRGWRLDVAGDGAERRALERLVRELGVVQSVRFLGQRGDIEFLLSSAGILLAPRMDEAFGLSVVEAMAAGLPVVAARAGGHLETVGTAEEACLFLPGDADEAARMLAELAADLARRDAYGLALQETQRTNFTLEAQERATDAVYRSVL